MSNHYEHQARQAKAVALAGALIASGAVAANVSDPGVRQAALAAVGKASASEATWTMVERLVASYGEAA